ncbi:aspartate/tyrosine/aromatic aminotransferase [Pseudoalteromonas shioyasakiensis]|jgi:aspartate aminotransferase|uniref:Aminotransferase n=2 Tax=Pseudoalteromonas TaxID=53246 RepID=A0A0P7EDU6_9GAMM|nr:MULTISPECIES: amino acid aminotransferase [Pseudoalteromonas]MBU75674.1 aspartate/tyrosine/aromatic aminotransferase [Pseudoalteromonadaceae bacterium]MDC3188648.1 aspartate/tyrosine/aromatic aminotransferase [Pseudoalteromonas elyakovii]MEC8207003.1 amino acid aminotransferase [Pseudomonadota bacterium]KPM83327.1 aromatic amino acid aminotransferase [Pseudoalteromonas lipolytica]KPW02988.1 Aspartate aminotransferase [Pseudoalteromonas sp. P1-8]|tara:strand:+ start:38141 stop:39331 length:1191 start_codon:yes stop_codon:yes gene_type:complete
MFSELKPLPTDPILGLMAAFKQDTNPKKIDLGVGVYKDEQGNTPVLKAVKKAEAFRLENETSKSYIGLAGNLDYCQKMENLLLGEHPALLANRVRTAQAPGGTGALRVAAEFIKRCNKDATVWVTTPTWANHISLFEAAGLTVKEYPYYDYENKDLLFDDMINTLKQVPKGDVVLFHACCHNPSGMDLNAEQWSTVADLAVEVGFTPLVDIAYQGFGSSLEEDAAGLRKLAAAVDELIICSSCSKNFGLYRERIGACSIIAKDAATADISNSVLLSVVRSIYSMPPAHGADIVSTILGSTELTQMWHDELDEMRNRINGLRTLIKESLAAKGIEQDFSFIDRQNGMFSFLGINKEQIERLQKEYSIYIVGSSRVNVAGISDANIDYFANAVADVCK